MTKRGRPSSEPLRIVTNRVHSSSRNSAENTVTSDQDLSELTSGLRGAGSGDQRLVVDGDRLLGAVSVRDLTERLSLRLELEQAGRTR